MFDTKSVVILCLSLAVLEANAKTVPFIDPCHYEDSDCMLTSAKKAMPYFVNGNPEFDIPSFSPLKMKNIKGDNGEFKLEFPDIAIEQIPKCEIVKVERLEKNKVDIELLCPLSATGHYIVGGKLLFLDIDGDGEFEVKTGKVRINVSIYLKLVKKNGHEHYKFSKFDFSYEALEKVYIKLENLFHGDKEKAAPILDILDKNWKEIIHVIARPIIEQMMKRIVGTIDQLVAKMPRNEFELDN